MSLERISILNGPGTVRERLGKIANQLDTEKSSALTTHLRAGKQDGRIWKIIIKFLTFLNLETSNAEKTANKLITYMEVKANRDNLFSDADRIENAKNLSRIVNKIIEGLPKSSAKVTTIMNKFKDLIPDFTPSDQPPKSEEKEEDNSKDKYYDQKIAKILHALDSSTANFSTDTYKDMLHYVLAAEKMKIYQADKALNKLIAKIKTEPGLITDEFIEYGLQQGVVYDSPSFFVLAKNEIIQFLKNHNTRSDPKLDNLWHKALKNGSLNGVTFLVENDLIQIQTYGLEEVNPLIEIGLQQKILLSDNDLEKVVNTVYHKCPKMLTNKVFDGWNNTELTPLLLAIENKHQAYVEILAKKLSPAEVSKFLGEYEIKDEGIREILMKKVAGQLN